MEAIEFRDKDFLKATQAWWYGWHGVVINERLLSRFGVAVMDGDSAVAVAYLYPVQTADCCWIGFTMRDPFLSPYKAGKALKLLIEEAETAVRRLGYSIIYTAYDAPALQKLVARRGYYAGSTVKEYFKELT